MDNEKTLVFGIGNEIITDDAIGPKLAKRLKSSLNYSNIDFGTAFIGGLDILGYIEGYTKVIFIDAIKTKGGVPGDVYLFSVDNFKETLHLSNLHDISFLTALELGKELGYKIPKDITIIAIEIVEDMVYSDNFSIEIEQKYEDIYQEVSEYVKQYA